ncbi:Nuclease SbcCD subunit D [anaerobic digester metagenome]
MKFIHLGDLHIGRTFEMRSMLEDQAFVLEQVLKLAQDRNPDFVLIAGDIYDRSVPREEAIAVYDDFITRLVLDHNIPVYAISGNHDSSRRLEGMGSLLKRSGYHICGSLKNPLERITLHDEHGPVDLYLMPYKDMHGARAIFEITDTRDHTETVRQMLTCVPADDHRKILAAHHYFGVNGQSPEESESERRISIGGEDVIDHSVLDPFQYVALGHLHKPQKVGRDCVRYAGSLLKYSASEADHKKSITWVEMDQDGQCRIELVPVRLLRDLKKIQGTFAELMQTGFLEKKDDFLAVTLTDAERVDQAFARLSQLYPNIISLAYSRLESDYELRVDQEAIRKADTRKLFADFFHDKNQRDMTEDEQTFMDDIFREMEVEA